MTRTPPLRHRLLAAAAMLFSVAPAVRAAGSAPSPADKLDTLPGFKVELVHKADPKVHGSWISLGTDNKGRLLLGGQRGQPLTRVTLGPDGKVAEEEVLKLPVSEIMGSLWAFDSLYLNGSDGKAFGLYRLKDANDDGEFDSCEMLREWKGGGGEHGAHGIVLGQDGKLYVVAGNFVDVPADVAPTSPHRNYADDLALPRAEDGNGFGAGRKPPGGYVVRLDPDGENAELVGAGQRNTYDVAFTADGELFGFDSDMEWDWGMPWYRPTRVFQVTSGADHGFREGTAKWPEYYPDSLPATVNIGIGSPTGVGYGAGAKFPAKYQKALYVLDWTYGRVMAVHLKPQGAGYAATWENFVAPKSLKTGKDKSPNNVTDVVVGKDGALYFTAGGRNTQGYLYRVTYTGTESTAPAELKDADGAEARALRRTLEAFHRTPDPKAVETAWPHLGSDDRYVRYAARIAVERQPVEQWKAKALAETNPQAGLNALLALARYGTAADQADVLNGLGRFPMSSLPEAQQLDKLRVVQVSLARHGKPAPELVQTIVEKLSPRYPAASFAMNRELGQVLLAVGAPDATAKAVELMSEAPTVEEQVAYAHDLRTVQTGWTAELRKQYFAWWTKDRSKGAHPPELLRWFEEAGRPYADGSSFPRFLGNFWTEARKTLAPGEEQSLADVLAAYTPPGPKQPAKKQPKPRKLVQQWSTGDLAPLLAQVGGKRNFERGKEAFEAAQCLACHKFGNEGGAIGPDLTAVSSRFSRADVLASITEPSKVISEQYQNTTVRLKDGDAVDGRVVEDRADALVVLPNPLEPDKKVTVKKADLKSVGPSKLSPMPEGLINVLTKDEVLDLLAYMESGGRKDHPNFK